MVSPRWRVTTGLVAMMLVGAAAVLGVWLLGSDGGREGRDDSTVPDASVDELDCLGGIWANTDFALDGDDGGDLIVCHYNKLPENQDGQSHRLASSKELSAAESRAVREAIAATPRGELPFTACDGGSEDRGEFFLVRTPTQVAYWVYNASCGDNGVLEMGADGEVAHRLVTPEVLQALGSTYGPVAPA